MLYRQQDYFEGLQFSSEGEVNGEDTTRKHRKRI